MFELFLSRDIRLFALFSCIIKETVLFVEASIQGLLLFKKIQYLEDFFLRTETWGGMLCSSYEHECS